MKVKTLTRPIAALMSGAIVMMAQIGLSNPAPQPREFRPYTCPNIPKYVGKRPASSEVDVDQPTGNVRVDGSKNRLRKMLLGGELKVLLSKAEMKALAFVESSHRNGLIGDQHLPQADWAYGMYQIRQCYVDDVNRHFGTNLRSTDCQFDDRLSYYVVQAYMNIYHKSGFEFKQYARMHNGGPNGHHRAKTLGYWKKVSRALAANS